MSSSSLQHQLECARARVKPFSVEQSPFFALFPVDLGATSAENLDKIIAEDTWKEDEAYEDTSY